MVNYSTSPWMSGELERWRSVTDGLTPKRFEKKRVILSAFSSDGVEKIIMFAARGGLFCEQCLFPDGKSPYTATAITDCDVFFVPRDRFLNALREDTRLLDYFIESMITRERLLIAEIADLSFVDVFHRIVTELCYCVRMHGEKSSDGVRIAIPITQQDMGNRVQATRLTVSKAMKRLMSEGIVRKDGLYYTVTDLERLEAYNKE